MGIITLIGEKKVMRKLTKLSKPQRNLALRTGVKAATNLLMKELKRNIPQSAKKRRKKGAKKRTSKKLIKTLKSRAMKRSKNVMGRRVFVDAEHAWTQEAGSKSKNIPGQEYMARSISKKRRQGRKLMIKEITKAIEKIWSGS